MSKPEIHYVGIRVTTPFRGMLAVRNTLMDELCTWGPGRLFHRLHVIDMNGPMDMEVGLVVPEPHEGDDRVRPGVLPAGRYACLTYVNHARRANKLLLEWTRDNGHALDRQDGPGGDHFACRYEAFVTDPRVERMKTKWQVELNIRLAESAVSR
ncbi:effector-binding domain-containing protein [Lentzea aerocolonigenes]|nr:effector-binding domain-containing protein [Lentzea aerocolonigenes]